MKSVVWLDPASENVNAGDEIIAEAIEAAGLAGLADAPRITTHRYLRSKEVAILRHADVVLVGGTNILRSNLWTSRQWPLSPWQVNAMKSKTVFLGVGWWQYQDGVASTTRRTLAHVSHPVVPHSVRDSYTMDRLTGIGVESLMTGCPTMWELDGLTPSSGSQGQRTVATTITDYHFDSEVDRQWLTLLSRRFDQVLMIGMGPGDTHVYDQLSLSANVQWAGYGTEAIARARDVTDLHVGTRLHAGVRWLQLSGRSLVLAVDNRALEISKDTNLAVVARADFDCISRWLDAEEAVSPRVDLPLKAIESWMAGWNDYVSA